jgi:hypothetical protein
MRSRVGPATIAAAIIGLFGCRIPEAEVEDGFATAGPAISRCRVKCQDRRGFTPAPPGVMRNQVVGAPVEAFLRDAPQKDWLFGNASTAEQLNEAASGLVDETMAVSGGRELMVGACRSVSCAEKAAFIVEPGPRVLGAAIIRAHPGRSDPQDRGEMLTMFLTAGSDHARFERAFTAWAMQSREEGRIVQRETVRLPARPASKAAPDCASGGAVEFPGPPLGARYGEVSKAVPASVQCREMTDKPCSYVEAGGHRISFTESRGSDPSGRYLFMKSAERGGGSRLPFGIEWTDTARSAAKKINKAGVPNSMETFTIHLVGEAPRRRVEVETPVCFKAQRAQFYMTFVFEGDRLLQVLQRDPAAY